MDVKVQPHLKDINSESDYVRCDICDISYIHKNDVENHNNSRSHQKKLHEKEGQFDKDEEKKFFCEYCNKKLVGEEFYKAHKGTKTHRRNVRKHAAKGEVKATATPTASNRSSRRIRRLSAGDHIDEKLYTHFMKQKYKTRYLIDDLNYKSYVHSLTAYLSIRLALDQSIEDFKISVNDKEWQVFGDIVIQIFSKEKWTTYAIQCKKVTQAFRQINQLEEAKVDTAKQYSYIAQLKDSGKDVHETKFIILTTRGTNSNFNHSVALKAVVLNKWKTSSEDIVLDGTLKIKPLSKKNDIINVTSEPENVYLFTLSENKDCRLPHLFLYTSQRVSTAMLNQLLKPKFEKCPDISTDYVKYIENWVDGKIGGHYKLRKKDVILKIGEILLNPYVVSPKKIQSKHDAFAIWNQVINNVDLTVVKNEPFTISKICQPLNMIIEETLSTTIDTITKSINLKQEVLRNVTEPIKSYFFEIGPDRLLEDIPLHLVYNIFWKAGRIPLLMSSENQEQIKGFILDVIIFMKQMGVNKKFLIKSADLNLNRYKGNLKIFTCLDDVKDILDWSEVKIMGSGTFHLPLSAIMSSDPFFFKWATPNIFFDISVGRYSLKPNYSSKKISNKKDVLKIILNDDVKDELEGNLYPERNSETNTGNCDISRLRGVDPSIL